MDVISMYVDQLMSIPEISKDTGIKLSTVRRKLLFAGVLRTPEEARKLALSKGKFGKALKGIKRVFSQEWKDNISKGKLKSAEKSAAGVSLKPNGYLEITRGPNKGRMHHVVVMEQIIGRRIFANEVVHHIDKNRTNNNPDNLQLMTRAEHAKLHAIENLQNRIRSKDGKFK